MLWTIFSPRTPQGKKRAEKESLNYLDRTMIHPESYSPSLKFISMVGLRPQDIGSDPFIRAIKQFMQANSKKVLMYLSKYLLLRTHILWGMWTPLYRMALNDKSTIPQSKVHFFHDCSLFILSHVCKHYWEKRKSMNKSSYSWSPNNYMHS